MTVKTRVYIVAPKIAEAGKPDSRRLVRGINQAQVGRYLADQWSITVASQEDLEALLPAGVKVEKAEQPAELPST